MNKESDVIAAIKQIVETIRNEQPNGEESFNMFTALGIERKEVYHSAFLKSLLNVGSNNEKKILKSFVEEVLEDKETEYESVEKEVDAGVINYEKTEGGRIDLLIKTKDNKKCIIIENKIYAGDQENQLLRYNQFGLNNYYKGNYKLVYLTLNGHAASEKSIGKKEDKKATLTAGKDYITISYKKSILEWLNGIKDNMDLVSENVKSAIEQYIIILKQLTRRNMELEEKIKEQFLLDPKNTLDYQEKLVFAYVSTEKILRSMKSMIEDHQEEMVKELSVKYKIQCKRESWFRYDFTILQNDEIKTIFTYDDTVGICCGIDFINETVKNDYKEKFQDLIYEDLNCPNSLIRYQKYDDEESRDKTFCSVYQVLDEIFSRLVPKV